MCSPPMTPALEQECARLASARALSADMVKRRLYSRRPAALLTVEEAWAGSVKVPVTGAGSLFAAAPSSGLTGGSGAAPGLRDQEG